MEGMLQAMIVVFMLFLCLLCLFAVFVIVRDLIVESAKARKDKMEPRAIAVPKQVETEVEKAIAATVQPVVVAEPDPEPAKEEAPIVEDEDENSVAFSKTGLTMEDKFAALSTEFKTYFNEIVRHVLSKEGIKEYKHSGSYDYKNASYKVMRISIKRSEIVCDFFFMDREILNYTKATNVKVKQSPAKIRVTDAESVGVAKDGIDLVCKQIAEDKEYKKELAREKRRERRRLANQNNSPVQTEKAEVEEVNE